MTWIKCSDEIPIQGISVRVKNGLKFETAKYYRGKWRSHGRFLHKVHEWEKCPVTYPKIPAKDYRQFMRKCERYKHQMQPKRFSPFSQEKSLERLLDN